MPPSDPIDRFPGETGITVGFFEDEYDAGNSWQEPSLDAPGLPPLSPTSSEGLSSPPPGPSRVRHGHEYHPFLTG